MNTLFGNKTKIVYGVGLLIGALMSLYKISFGLGFLSGMLISIINTLLLEYHTWKILKLRVYRSFSGYLFYLFRSFLLVIPFILALKWPESFNVFTAVLGVLYFKIVLFGSVLYPKKEA